MLPVFSSDDAMKKVCGSRSAQGCLAAVLLSCADIFCSTTVDINRVVLPVLAVASSHQRSHAQSTLTAATFSLTRSLAESLPVSNTTTITGPQENRRAATAQAVRNRLGGQLRRRTVDIRRRLLETARVEVLDLPPVCMPATRVVDASQNGGASGAGASCELKYRPPSLLLSRAPTQSMSCHRSGCGS